MAPSNADTGFLRNFLRLLHTVRHLTARQLWFQLHRRLVRRRIVTEVKGPTSGTPLRLAPTPEKPTSHLGGGCFRFLNCEVDLGLPIDWRAGRCPLLWQYNLHYFDFLQQPSMSVDSGLVLIRDWIERHLPAARAIGWQPYPISLRVVNWLKFISRESTFPSDVAQSLSLQGINLERQVEYHILGNHLFANGKALWFLGVALGRPRWIDIGKGIVLSQLPEQFLPDGGHFELSPMYHSLAVEDLLDLMNLCRSQNDIDSNLLLRETTERALGWMEGLMDASAHFSLLNDAAYGIAPTYQQLLEYAERCSVKPLRHSFGTRMDGGWNSRNFSGYRVIRNDDFRVLFDTALLGPDYLPGHAHCDMLSILLEFRGENVLADTGVYEYAETANRNYSRSTAAHNTVSLDGLEQADIWKSFRMGKRGHPNEVRETSCEISCEHDGFSKQRRGLKHKRTLRLLANGIEVFDEVSGPAAHRFQAYFHFEPGLRLQEIRPNEFLTTNGLVCSVSGGAATRTSTEYYPEFGLIQTRECLVVSGTFRFNHRFRFRCTSSS